MPESSSLPSTPALTYAAPAKVNLYLGVHPERDARGYHRVDSVMIALELADIVRVEPASTLNVRCIPPADFPAHKNTAWRAAEILAQTLGKDAHVAITLEKHIPSMSGMGGASSDAASVLQALCQLWGIDGREERVLHVAREVGADVPFFLDPLPTLLGGAGDVALEQFAPLDGVAVVVVRPAGAGVSTKSAYEEFDRMLPAAADPEPLCSALRAGDARAVAAALANNLEPVALKLASGVGEVKSWLERQPGVWGCQVTGSGSCVFAICESFACAQEIAERAREPRTTGAREGWWAQATKTISHSNQISSEI
ncbi:MAG: 4-(cytidine 5'-diphospho)-2-C-methyl-D-erythritol kinase [Atopobiaceae bacterium]|jgi:4-diphosphocytidyl-2-C-methyl-D-erythritol kinase